MKIPAVTIPSVMTISTPTPVQAITPSAGGTKKRISRLGLVAGLCGLFAAVPSPAYAYLDPGTGSLILQSAIGAIVAGLAIGRIYWEKIKAFIWKVEPRSPSSGTGNDEARTKDAGKG